MKSLVLEAITVGIALAGSGKILVAIAPNLSLSNYLFVLGAAFHLLCEILGVNKWYCVNGNACLKNRVRSLTMK